MRIAISDLQAAGRVRHAEVQRLARHFLEHGKPRLGAGASGRLTLILTDDAAMREANSRTFGKAGTTDVISCRYEPLPGEKGGAADIFVNVQRAREEGGRRPRWSADRELALYLAHGIDHLSGADDATPAQRQRMRRRELGWLRKAGAIRLFATSQAAPRRSRAAGAP